jgi:predicted glycosyltransferase
MRVWIDLTNSPHVLVMRPVIDVLREEGHEVSVTARDFAQTLQLLDRFAIDHTAIGRHRGERLVDKAVGLASRSAALVRWARGESAARPPGAHPLAATGSNGTGRLARASGAHRRARPFDIAIGHGSNDVSVASRLLGIPCSTMFDYEWAAVQHHVNCRLARAVVVPEAIPPERLDRYGARGKVRAYEGLKEEYYLADFEPDPAVIEELAIDRTRPIVVVRTPPEVSLYHRFENDLFASVLAHLRDAAGVYGEARGGAVQSVVLPRTDSQRAELCGVPGFTVPERAIDAQSLIAFADLVISAGGTMNREAVALGTPVYTTFEGRLGAVDERLIVEGRLRKLAGVDQLEFSKRGRSTDATRTRREPRRLVELLLSPLSE